MNAPQEWQRLAWALGAEDCATDEPTDETDPETAGWRDWAERVHGARAREFIAATDVLNRIRSTPAPKPHATEGGRVRLSDMRDAWSRTISAAIDSHGIPDDTQLFSIATDYVDLLHCGGSIGRVQDLADTLRAMIRSAYALR